MKDFRFAILAGSILLLCTMILIQPQTGNAQQTRTTEIVNTAANPVPTRNVDNPARQPYQIGFELFGQDAPSVPAGKVFVIEHISGSIRVQSPFDAPSPCRILQLALLAGGTRGIEVIPVSMGSGRGVDGDINFFSISQPVRVYATSNSTIGAASMVLSQYCNSFPLNSSQFVFTGHLVDAN